MDELEEAEHWIDGSPGRFLARSWMPRRSTSSIPIILFHDSLGCVSLWRDFPARLATRTGRQVVAYDRPGFGRSVARHDFLDKDFIALEAEQSVLPLLRALGLREFIACGHSVGGGMAVGAGARFAEQCRGVVTIAAQAFVERRTLDGIKVAKKEFEHGDNLARLAKYHGEKAEWVLKSWIDTWLSPSFSDWSLEPSLRRVQCPVLAVHGENDEFGSAEHPRRIAAGRGEVRLLPGVGHNPHRECPDLLVDVVERFSRQFPDR